MGSPSRYAIDPTIAKAYCAESDARSSTLPRRRDTRTSVRRARATPIRSCTARQIAQPVVERRCPGRPAVPSPADRRTATGAVGLVADDAVVAIVAAAPHRLGVEPHAAQPRCPRSVCPDRAPSTAPGLTATLAAAGPLVGALRHDLAAQREPELVPDHAPVEHRPARPRPSSPEPRPRQEAARERQSGRSLRAAMGANSERAQRSAPRPSRSARSSDPAGRSPRR